MVIERQPRAMTARAERSPRRRTTPGVECPPQGHRQRASQQAHRREREGTTALPLHDRHCTHARDGEGKAPSAGQQPAAAMREWGGIGRPGLLMTNGASPVGPSPDGTTAIGGPLVIERQPRAMTARAERSPRRRTMPGVECPPRGHQRQAHRAQAPQAGTTRYSRTTPYRIAQTPCPTRPYKAAHAGREAAAAERVRARELLQQQQDQEHLRIVTGVNHVRRGGHVTHG